MFEVLCIYLETNSINTFLLSYSLTPDSSRISWTLLDCLPDLPRTRTRLFADSGSSCDRYTGLARDTKPNPSRLQVLIPFFTLASLRTLLYDKLCNSCIVAKPLILHFVAWFSAILSRTLWRHRGAHSHTDCSVRLSLMVCHIVHRKLFFNRDIRTPSWFTDLAESTISITCSFYN